MQSQLLHLLYARGVEGGFLMSWKRIGTMLDELCAILHAKGGTVIEISITLSPVDDEETAAASQRTAGGAPVEE